MNADTLHSSTQPHEHSHDTTSNHAATAAASHDAGGHAGAHGSHDVPPEKVFTHLLGELGDHHGLVFFSHVADLPIMMVDEGTFHAYANPTKMEEAGKFVMYKGHPARKADMKPPQLDLSITNFVMFQWMAMFILLAVGIISANRYKKNPKKGPRGIQNMLETFVVYLRDEVVYPNIKPRAAAERLLPYFLSLFTFILLLNVFGLLPGGHSATGAIGVTAGLAIISFLVINFTAIRESGIGAWFAHLTGGAPLYMAPIMVPIEVLSLFIKPFVLTMRLFANMAAGHIVLLSFIGLIFFFRSIYVGFPSTLFSVFIYFLETLAAFLQAYIFTMLTAVFTGMAIGDHAHDEHH